MTLLVYLSQYWLHLSEITDTDTKDNDRYYRSDYRCITSICVHVSVHVHIGKLGQYH